MSKFFEEVTLLGQKFVINPDLTVAEAARQAGVEVVGYARVEVGEPVLDHHRHLVRIFGEDVGRHGHVGCAGLEGDVEVVRAGDAAGTGRAREAGEPLSLAAVGDSLVAGGPVRDALAERAHLVDMEGFAVATACRVLARRAVSSEEKGSSSRTTGRSSIRVRARAARWRLACR